MLELCLICRLNAKPFQKYKKGHICHDCAKKRIATIKQELLMAADKCIADYLAEDLLPCPCCGCEGIKSTHQRIGLNPSFYIACVGCGLTTPKCERFAIARRKWNKRSK